jgi:hypothetical protein
MKFQLWPEWFVLPETCDSRDVTDPINMLSNKI